MFYDQRFSFSSRDAQVASRFTAQRQSVQISDFREGELEKAKAKARRLLPELGGIRKNLESDQCGAGAKLHIPLLKEFLKTHDVGGAAWRDQSVDGFPTLGGLAEPGVCSLSPQRKPGPFSRDRLLQSASSRFEPGGSGADANFPKLCEDALVRVAKGWLCGPRG